jgi:hypothetical protein
MDLHPCERCGSVRTPWESGLTFVRGEPARNYYGACGKCGRSRSFLFRSPDPRELPPASGLVTFGGPAPSTPIDAGEWLWVADLTASRVPANDPAGARQALSIATAAMKEILKFIPDGAPRVPDEGFWSARGREMRAAEPARFDRELVELIRDARTGTSWPRCRERPVTG